jgi:hypothetical protein
MAIVESEKSLKRFEHRGVECKNCGAELDLADRYCHFCGQVNNSKKISLKDYTLEFFASFLSYDSRLWRTVSNTLFNPGKYPKQYISGKRASYANPFRFYFTVSIVFFLVVRIALFFENSIHLEDKGSPINISLRDASEDKDRTVPTDSNQIAATKTIEPYKFKGDTVEQTTVDQANEKQQQSIETPINTVESSEEKKPDEPELPDDALPVERDIAMGKFHGNDFYSEEKLENYGVFKKGFHLINMYPVYIDRHNDYSYEDCLEYFGHQPSDLKAFVHERSITLARIKDDPTVLAEVFLPKAPLFIFFFVPFFSLFNWLIYARKKTNYIEHIIFNFSIFIFLFLGLIPLFTIDSLLETSILTNLFLLFAGPIYLYKAMRRFYEQRRAKTILKFLLINFAFGILASIGIVIFTVIGLLIA